MNLALIVFLTLLNALFAMSEMALASSRKTRLTILAETHDKGAMAALKLMDKPTQFLSTVQIGITTLSMLSGIVGEAAFSENLKNQLIAWHLHPPVANFLATTLVVGGLAFFSLVFGELVPKRIGQIYPETIACLMAIPMQWLAKLARPAVSLLTACTQGIIKSLGIDSNTSPTVTAEEIKASLSEGVDAGLIEQHEHQMVHNVLHLDDRNLASIMVPRANIVWLDASWSIDQAAHFLLQLHREGKNVHSWYPLCKGSLDHVLGQINASDIMQEYVLYGNKINTLDDKSEENQLSSIKNILKPATFIPETLSGMEMLEQFRTQSTRMVFVVDEYGVVQGLLTPRDLLEAITGELKPQANALLWATELSQGQWQLDGLMPITELKARLEIETFPQEEKGRYHTLSGLLTNLLGNLPQAGDVLEYDRWQFQIISLQGRRVGKVLATPITHSNH